MDDKQKTKQISNLLLIGVGFMIILVGYAFYSGYLGGIVLAIISGTVLFCGLALVKNGVTKMLSGQLVLLTGYVIAIGVSTMYQPDPVEGPLDYAFSWNYLVILVIVILSFIGSVIAGSKSSDSNNKG